MRNPLSFLGKGAQATWKLPAEGSGECDVPPSPGNQGEEAGDLYSKPWWPSCDILHPTLHLHGDQHHQHYFLTGRAGGRVEHGGRTQEHIS